MKLQNIVFPKSGMCSESRMYARLDYENDAKACFAENDTQISFKKGGRASFDTYFNSLSVEKWTKYTEAKSFKAVMTIKGSFEIRMFSVRIINKDILRREYSLNTVSFDNVQTIALPFRTFDQVGMFAFELKALSDDSVFYGGYYEADVDESKLREVNIAINICTFKREAYLMHNLDVLNEEILKNPKSELYDHLQVYISDNGQTLDIDKLATDKIHIVKNANVGGAGGFTRGLLEIMDHDDSYHATHALMMDDDISIMPEALYRTWAVLSCAKKEYKDAFIGGAMLRNDRQNIQVESGASWNAGEIISNMKGYDMNRLSSVLENDIEEYTEYNAWWYCCTPMSVVNRENLPLPIFIRGDDLEYGLRNMKTLILMNGICVWHEPFEYKNASNLYYYIFRNRLYDNALHFKKYSKKQFFKDFRREYMREVMFYRYKNVDLLLRGVRDFYKGVDFLLTTDGEALHKDIMASGYKMTPLEQLDVPFHYNDYANNLDIFRTLKGRLWALITLNGLLLPANRYSAVPVASCRPKSFYRASKVLHYDPTSRKGFVTVRSHKEIIRYMLELWKFYKETNRNYDRCMKEFDRRHNELTNETFWRKYLGLSAGEAQD